MNTTAVGDRIKRLRVEQGLSQRALSEPGISFAYVSRIENGTRTPSLTALMKLAKRLNVTALYLLTGREDGPCPLCGRKGK
jgi:transcriptional regulator with XRE-family HTH domain